LNYHVLANQADPVRRTTEEVNDQTVVHVVRMVNDDSVKVPIYIVIPESARQAEGSAVSHYMVKFELLDGRTRATVDTVVRPLDVARHVQIYNTPRKPPTIKVSPAEISSRVNLEIKQVDPGATSVQIFRKQIFRSSVETDEYTLIGTYPLTTKQQTLLVPVEKPLNTVVIYRVVPVGQLGTQGFEYSNVVVRPNRYTPIKAISVTGQNTDAGVQVEVRQIPTTVVSVEVLARNLSTFESESDYRNVGDVISLIDDSTRASDYVSVLDAEVSEGWIYEYVVRLTHTDGLVELSGNAVVEFIKLTPGKVDLQITNLQVAEVGAEPNVTFNVQSLVLDQNIDVVLSLLKKQDIQQFFNNDIQREREFLKRLMTRSFERTARSVRCVTVRSIATR
jgi:hypothetical protein